MKTIFLTISLILILINGALAQQWEPTDNVPDGASATDIVVTPIGTWIVTTTSVSLSPGLYGGVRRSTNDGQTWQNPLDGFNGRTLHLGNNGVVFASFWPFPINEGLYRSTNDGINWTNIHIVSSGDNIFSITSKNDNNTIFIGTRNGIQRSTNAGSNWFSMNNGIPVNSWVRDLAVDSTTGIVIAATTNGVFSTTNDGTAWQLVSGFEPLDTIVTINIDYPIPAFDNTEVSRVHFGSRRGNLYNGAVSDPLKIDLILYAGNFELAGLINEKSTSFEVYGFAAFPLIGEGGGWYFFSDNGFSYSPANGGLASDFYATGVYQLDGFGGAVLVGSGSQRTQLYTRNFIIGIELISSQIPSEYKLKQNYPNPFNPSTKIEFDIPQNKGVVKLTVYNSLGQFVKTLVNSELSPGTYQYTFDGSELTSGVYYYKLETENYSETNKMLLIK
jgi:hypothetical protein